MERPGSRTGNPVAYGLLAGAGLIAALGVLWLLTSGAQAGGIVLGLMIVGVLAGPLAVAGWYLLGRSKEEAVEASAFAGKQRILDADRLFRRELAAEVRQLARQAGLPADRLAALAEDLERETSAVNSAAWFDSVALNDGDAATLRQYDDLAWERVRRLDRMGVSGDRAEVEAAVLALQDALDQRRDLLLRGRRAPIAAPSEMLRAGEPLTGADALDRLARRDAISLDDGDYVVEGLATYFQEGQTWTLARLEPSGAGSPRWLYVGPGGLSVALMDEVPAPEPGSARVQLDGLDLARGERGTATVDVVSPAGSARGVLVEVEAYRGATGVGQVERWPDGAVHAYAGRLIRASDVKRWPAEQAAEGPRGA